VAIRIAAILLALCFGLAGQRPATRAKASDYPAHFKLSNMEIGAEFLPHGIPGSSGAFSGKEYLVVEVAIFPLTKAGIAISRSQFTLRVDDSKTALRALSPGTAVAQAGGLSHGSVELGGPPLASHFPGDEREQDKMPRGPIPLEPGQQQSTSADLEGTHTKPVSAYLLFHLSGDSKSIRSLELEYDGGGARKAKLRLL
jgi:hypothetical protein